MKQSIKIKDFSIFFTNVNREMKLKGHSHFALVSLTFGHDRTGFPAFEETYAYIKKELRTLTAKPFMDATNEEIARKIFEHFSTIEYWQLNWKYHTTTFYLQSITLSVRGVLDDLGHADGFTDYTVEKD